MTLPTMTPQEFEDSMKKAMASAMVTSRINLGGPQTPNGPATGMKLPELPGVVTLFTSGVSGMVKAVGDTIDVWRNASNLGINFGSDAVALRSSIGTTRLSVEEYSQVLSRASQGFTAFGGIMSDSARKFNQLSYEFGTNFGDQLMKAGFTVKEYNEVLALANTGNRRMYAEGSAANKAAQEAAYNLATEMDKVAQISGLSRKAQQDAVFERQQDARLQATLLQEQKNGNANIKAQYDIAANQFRQFGKPMEDLVRDMFLGGRLTQKSIDLVSALGGDIGSELRTVMTQLKEASRTGDKDKIKEAQDAVTNALANVAKRMESDPNLTNIAKNQGAAFEVLGETFIKSQGLRDAIAAEQARVLEVEKRHIDQREALNNLRIQAENYAQGQNRSGQAIAGAQTTELFLRTQARLADAQTVLSRMIDAGNTALGKTDTVAKALDILQNVKEVGGKPFADRFGDKFDDVMKKIKDGTLKPEDISGKLKEITTEITSFLKTSGVDLGSTVLQEAFTMGKMVAQGFGDAMLDLLKQAARASAPDVPPRHGGTIGETGRLREVGNPIVQLKDKETVFTDEQLMNFARNSAGSSLDAMRNIASSLETAVSPGDKSDMTYINLFTDMFKDIQTKISPANIPNTVTFDRQSIDTLGEKLSSTVESIAASMKENKLEVQPTVETNFDDTINTAFVEFQRVMPTIADAFNRGMSDLTTIIPTIGQNQTRDLVRIIPTEIQQARYENQRQEEARRRVEPTTVQPATPAENPINNVALDELKELLNQLNTTMGSSVVGQLSELVGVTERQVRATRRLDPNISVR